MKALLLKTQGFPDNKTSAFKKISMGWKDFLFVVIGQSDFFSVLSLL